MRNNFQIRLVKPIVVITISIIVLFLLFDKNKKHNKIEFEEFSLIPKDRSIYKIEPITLINAKIVAISLEKDEEGIISNNVSNLKDKLENNFSFQEKKTKSVIKIVKNKELILEKINKLNRKIKIPKGRAYVIQLGVLKNIEKAEEIITKLRFSGYQVYSKPSLPVNGQLTRIFIGLNASREKLQSILPNLKNLTGLQGIIQNYKP